MDMGFDAASVVLASISPERIGIATNRRPRSRSELLRRLAAQPGVRHAGLGEFEPLGGSNTPMHVLLSGRETQTTDTERVTPGYFQAVGMTVIRGRGLSREDHQGGPGSPWPTRLGSGGSSPAATPWARASASTRRGRRRRRRPARSRW